MGEEVQNRPETSSTGAPKLNRTIEVITSLTSLSYTVKVFSTKWLMIRTKLEELSTGLIAAENCQSLEENQPLAELVQAVSQTVSGCISLAHRCIDVSYSGKLLMQSDLDLACAKLDVHIKDLSGVYTAGVLSNGLAIVVSRPGPAASRDDMRFYLKDLATRMKIGDVEMKRQAVVALNEIVTEDERYVRLVVESCEIVGFLARFLHSSEVEIQYESANILSVICGFDSHRSVLVAAGIIAPLIRVLEGGGTGKGKECAIKCLIKLTENSDNAWSVSAHGGITALLNICNAEEEKLRRQLIGPTCAVLKNVVGVEEIKRFMVDEGTIPLFIKLVGSKDEPSQVNSIEFLQAMASGDEPIRQTLIREGILDALIRVLDPRSSYLSSKSRVTALKLVENLCFSSQSSLTLLVGHGHGFMSHLLYFLRTGEVSIQELAFKVSIRLCGTSDEIRKRMGELGFMGEFVKFLEAKSYEIREMAAEAIAGMVKMHSNRKKFVEEENNIGLILQTINDSEEKGGGHSSEVISFLLSVLLELSSCKVTRRMILSSECLKSIEKLADSGVSDAKKIVRKISDNIFQSMVRKFLHK